MGLNSCLVSLKALLHFNFECLVQSVSNLFESFFFTFPEDLLCMYAVIYRKTTSLGLSLFLLISRCLFCTFPLLSLLHSDCFYIQAFLFTPPPGWTWLLIYSHVFRNLENNHFSGVVPKQFESIQELKWEKWSMVIFWFLKFYFKLIFWYWHQY